jgi:hypothetical protein
MSRLDSVMDVLGKVVPGILGGPGLLAESPAFEGGEGLKRAWLWWREMTYAGTSTTGPGSGVDLSALDRQLTASFDEYFAAGELDPAALERLERCVATLTRVVPSLSGDARRYFAMASSIARWVLEESGIPSEPPPFWKPTAQIPGQPRRIAIAAYGQVAAGALVALVGLASPLFGGNLASVAIFGALGALMVALGAGLYFHNGLARVTGVVFAVPAWFIAVLGMAFSDGIGYVLIPSLATWIASTLVIVAVASTANWVTLLGRDR